MLARPNTNGSQAEGSDKTTGFVERRKALGRVVMHEILPSGTKARRYASKVIETSGYAALTRPTKLAQRHSPLIQLVDKPVVVELFDKSQIDKLFGLSSLGFQVARHDRFQTL